MNNEEVGNIFRCLIILTCGVIGNSVTYKPFQDPVYGEFGLKTDKDVPCLSLRFGLKLYNYNLNGSDIASELTDLTSKRVKLKGICVSKDDKERNSKLEAVWSVGQRQKALQFLFQSTIGTAQANQEVRWKLRKVVYHEKLKDLHVRFESANDTSLISAPLRQKFLCRDRINITLHSPPYQDMVLEFLPEIDFQPINADLSYGSNVYVCERTRRRTLAESFQSKMTIFSGVVLGFSSVVTLVGYSLRRQLLPSRQQFYTSF
jgi:hypothetical protein